MWKRILVVILALSFIFTGCEEDKAKNINRKVSIAGSSGERRLSVWTTYWDTSDLEDEFDKIGDSIENILHFAAYFDEDKRLFIPDATKGTYDMTKANHSEKDYGNYLTFVNDLLRKDKKPLLKDTGLLYDLFKSDESMNNHIKEILDITIDGGYDGIEIDYEGMKQDILLWDLFIDFVERLNDKTIEEDISLRIVLEPNFPVELITFPDGPEYVMMCYNLHGYGTAPGPKADRKFILDMVEKMEQLPGNINFAMSSGGFKFYEDKVEQLSEKEAVELARIHNATITRDGSSQAVFFTYRDDKAISYEVWYADHETLDFWFSIVEEVGDYGLSLWRMGGNLRILP